MPPNEGSRVSSRAWWALVLGVAAQASGTFLVSTPAYLIPLLHLQQGASLAQAGLLAAAPTFGVMLTLVLWGALADRYGERWVIAGGIGLTGLFAFLAAPAPDLVWLGVLLVLGGAASASVNAASGRMVVGWFPARRRGTAMGIRQMSQPLGVAAAALAVPPLAQQHGVAGPLLAAGALCVVVALACALRLVDPPRPDITTADVPSESPYRGSGFLLRIHLLSVLLVVPQFTLSTFGLVWLMADLGWSAAAAGAVVALAQFIGAFGRIAVGSLSDRVGSRVRVLRWVAVGGVLTMGLLALTGALEWRMFAGVVLVLATTVSVADNGLAFTSVAEAAGSRWSGRALGIQNTGQFLASSLMIPGIGALIAVVGYPLAFAFVALTPLAAVPLVPRHDRHRR